MLLIRKHFRVLKVLLMQTDIFHFLMFCALIFIHVHMFACALQCGKSTESGIEEAVVKRKGLFYHE